MTAAAGAAGERLARCYRGIGERRMAGLPVCNQALAVEAVGFRPFAGMALGVLVTPWCMNLVLVGPPDPGSRAADGPAPVPGVPGAGPPGPDRRASLQPSPRIRPGATRDVDFPAGTITMTVSELEGFGPVESASLFSPMHEFATPALARAAALAALQAVLAVPGPAAPGPIANHPAANHPAANRPIAQGRRGLLFGRGAAA